MQKKGQTVDVVPLVIDPAVQEALEGEAVAAHDLQDTSLSEGVAVGYWQRIKYKFKQLLDFFETKLPAVAKKEQPISPPTCSSRTQACIKKSGEYASQTVQDLATGHAAASEASNACNIAITPQYLAYLPVYAVISIVGQVGHRVASPVGRFIALVARNFLKMGETLPAIASLGTLVLTTAGLDATVANPGVITVFSLSIAISLLKYGLDKIFASSNKKKEEVAAAFAGKAARCRRKFIGFIKELLLPILKRLGQGALLKEVLYFFIGLLYQQLGWVGENDVTPVASSPWLNLLLAVPAAMEFILFIGTKTNCASSTTKSRMEKGKIFFEASMAACQVGALVTLLATKVVGTLTAGDQIDFWPFIGTMFGGAAAAALTASYSLIRSFRKRAEEAKQVSNDEESQRGFSLRTLPDNALDLESDVSVVISPRTSLSSTTSSSLVLVAATLGDASANMLPPQPLPEAVSFGLPRHSPRMFKSQDDRRRLLGADDIPLDLLRSQLAADELMVAANSR